MASTKASMIEHSHKRNIKKKLEMIIIVVVINSDGKEE